MVSLKYSQMKNALRISTVIFLFLFIFIIHSCKKDKPVTPVITTRGVTEISFNNAKSGGNVSSDGGTVIIANGVCWGTTADPTIANNKTVDGKGTGTFTSSITALIAGTVYYVRAYATNSAGIGYGAGISFTTTAASVPVLTTTAVSLITLTTATSGGNVTSEGGTTATARGVCWSTSANPTTVLTTKTSDGTGTGVFTSSLTGLTANTTYYVRAYTSNISGTGYGNELIFKTYAGTVTDIEGNIYNTVTIGTQTWIAENLKTTKYNDGTAIPNITDNIAWTAATTSAYSDYNNTPANSTIYGRLYNWYAVDNNAATKVASNGGKNVCPTSWHVPTDTEWTTLTTYLGGESVAGGKLKETGTTYWTTPNTGATNETGFTALPGGDRSFSGGYDNIGYYGAWWSSTKKTWTSPNAYYRNLYYGDRGIYRGEFRELSGFSVRCVKDF